jgi:phage terminase small subunit
MPKRKKNLAPVVKDEQGEALPQLNPREQKFIAHYSVHFNGAAAVRFAGYKTDWANAYARELLARPEIQQHVDKARKDLGTLHFDLFNQAVSKLALMMQADRTEILDAEGNVKDPEEWPEECKLLIAGIEIEERMQGEGDAAEMIRVKKVKLEGPKGIIDSLAKLTGNVVEKHQMLGKDGKPTDPSVPIAPVIYMTVGAPVKPGGKK